ncbi:MAG: hypothetical protein Q4G49_08995, partial [Paracoccus sp. (in: a-proteobacteria)]|nr:hypothetical protein [Paracoccus sp. (in: a-proteobacteria)]
AQVLAEMPQLAGMIRLRPHTGETGLQFLSRLRSSTTPEDAVTFTAFAALPREAAGWGYECLRLMADHLSAPERPMMQDIAAWLSAPSVSLRHKIMRDALYAPTRPPSVYLALAVGWSTGGPAPNDPEQAPPHKTPVAVNSSVLSCLARADIQRRPVYLARFLDMAESLFRAYETR